MSGTTSETAAEPATIETLQAENAQLRSAFEFVEDLLNKIGTMSAATAARAKATNQMLVLKGICTTDEILATEARVMLELSGQSPEQGIIDPGQKEIIRAN